MYVSCVFNEGVSNVNSQEYVSSLEHFNNVLTMAEVVGDSANDMKLKAQEQIPLAYYRQAIQQYRLSRKHNHGI